MSFTFLSFLAILIQLLGDTQGLLCNQCIASTCTHETNCMETVHNYTYQINRKFRLGDSTWAYSTPECPKNTLGLKRTVQENWTHTIKCDFDQNCGHFLVKIERRRVTSSHQMSVPILTGIKNTRVVYFGCVSQIHPASFQNTSPRISLVGQSSTVDMSRPNIVFNEIEREKSNKLDEQSQIESRGIVESYGECSTGDFCNNFSSCSECIEMDNLAESTSDTEEISTEKHNIGSHFKINLLLLLMASLQTTLLGY